MVRLVLSSLSALAALVSVVSALPSLLVEVSGPSQIHGIDSFNITTTVTNAGDETLKLLNHPRGPLSDLPTDMFTITNRYGFSPEFVGISAKYVPAVALASGHSSAFTVLAPGESIVVHHPVSAAYDFSTSGPGQYIIMMKNLNTFYYAFGDGIAALVAGSGHAFHVVDVHGTRSQIQANPQFDVRACEHWQKRAIEGVIPLAENYVHNALDELTHKETHGAAYKRWFGAESGNRLSEVAAHFKAVSNREFSDLTYVCDTRFCVNRPGVLAYAYPNIYGTVHLCNDFFDAHVGGYNSRASTLVHEALQFTRNGGLEEHAHGERLGHELAHSYPYLAVANADNHEYFAAAAHGDGEGDASVLLAQVHFGKYILDL